MLVLKHLGLVVVVLRCGWIYIDHFIANLLSSVQ